MENKNKALELFDYIIELSKTDQMGKNLYISLRDKLHNQSFVFKDESEYYATFPELCNPQFCSPSIINIAQKESLKKYTKISTEAFLAQSSEERAEWDKKNEMVTEKIGYILDNSDRAQENFLRLLINIIRRYIDFYGDEKEKEELIEAFIVCLNMLFPFTTPAIENLDCPRKETPTSAFFFQRNYLISAISTLSFYCNTGSALKIFINNFTKYRFTFDTFRECFIMPKKEKSVFLFDYYFNESTRIILGQPCPLEKVSSSIFNSKHKKMYLELIDKYNAVNAEKHSCSYEEIKPNYDNTIKEFSKNEIELGEFLSSCDESDLNFIKKLILPFMIDLDEESAQLRLKAFKDLLLEFFNEGLDQLENKTIITPELIKEFKDDIEVVTLDNIKSFVDKYYLAPEFIDPQDENFKKYSKISDLITYALLKKNKDIKIVSTFRDIIPNMLLTDEKPVKNFIEVCVNEINKRYEQLPEKNAEKLKKIEQYKKYFEDRNEMKKKILAFFDSASSNVEQELRPSSEEYQKIMNNKKLVEVLISSQIFKEDLDNNKDIYTTLPGGDYTLFVVGFIKALERYLKEIHIQNPAFSNGLWVNNSFFPLIRDKDYIVAFDVSNKELPVRLVNNPTNITLASLSNSFNCYLQQSGNSSNIFKKDFKRDFINEVRNGKLHVKTIESYEEAQKVYERTAYYFRKCIDEFDFELKE